MGTTGLRTGLRLAIANHDEGSLVGEVVFHDFPVRIGRDALAEVSLPYGFVTRWHAILAMEGEAVLLWDLGSTNGTTIGSPATRLAPHEKVDLRPRGMAFTIGPLHFTVEVVQAEPAPRQRDRGGPLLSSVVADAPAPRLGEREAVEAAAVEARALARELRGAHGAYRGAWKAFYDQLAASLGTRSPSARAPLLRALAVELPDLFAEPEAQSSASAGRSASLRRSCGRRQRHETKPSRSRS